MYVCVAKWKFCFHLSFSWFSLSLIYSKLKRCFPHLVRFGSTGNGLRLSASVIVSRPPLFTTNTKHKYYFTRVRTRTRSFPFMSLNLRSGCASAKLSDNCRLDEKCSNGGGGGWWLMLTCVCVAFACGKKAICSTTSQWIFEWQWQTSACKPNHCIQAYDPLLFDFFFVAVWFGCSCPHEWMREWVNEPSPSTTSHETFRWNRKVLSLASYVIRSPPFFSLFFFLFLLCSRPRC